MRIIVMDEGPIGGIVGGWLARGFLEDGATLPFASTCPRIRASRLYRGLPRRK